MSDLSLTARDIHYSQRPCDLCRRHAKLEVVDGRGFVYARLCPDHDASSLAGLLAHWTNPRPLGLA